MAAKRVASFCLLMDSRESQHFADILFFASELERKITRRTKKKLGKFSYSVRKSSEKFCKKLLSNSLSFDKKPSVVTRNRTGAFGESADLKDDPTIKAMIGMLDLIYNRLKDKDLPEIERYKANLKNITFSIFNMREYSLGEELYIKMNSRGKQLSSYENLKAYMEKDLDLKDEIDRELFVGIDAKWSDFFFENAFKNSKLDENKFNQQGRNFLHYVNVFFRLGENKQEKRLTEEEIKKLLELERRIDDFYEPLKKKRENIQILDKCIDLFLSLKQENKEDGNKIPKGIEILEDDFFIEDFGYIKASFFFAFLILCPKYPKEKRMFGCKECKNMGPFESMQTFDKKS